jgi:hypothetical protein
MEHCLRGFLLSDVLHVGEHVIGEESHPKRRDLWQVTSCRDKNRVLAGSSKMHQKRVTFGRVQEYGVLCPTPQKGIFQKIEGWNSQRDDPDWQSENDHIPL